MPEGSEKRTRKSTVPAAEAPFVEHAEIPIEPVWEEPTHEPGPVASSEVQPTTAPDSSNTLFTSVLNSIAVFGSYMSRSSR